MGSARCRAWRNRRENFDEERHVDRMRDGAANLDVGQFLAAEVELDGIGPRVAFIALGRDDEALVLGKPSHIRDRQPRERRVVQFAGFHLRRSRRTIGDDAPDDAIEIGRVRAPVILVAVGDDVLPALVFDELERAGADGRKISRVLADVAALIKMLGRDVAKVGQGAQQELSGIGRSYLNIAVCSSGVSTAVRNSCSVEP